MFPYLKKLKKRSEKTSQGGGMGGRGDKRSIYNGESETTENESTLVNTNDHLFCSFIINDANIALETPLSSLWVLEFSKIVCHYLPGDIWGREVWRISDKW